ncbi:unnamed protein product [Ectocarpus sp. 4 AP-2014]
MSDPMDVTTGPVAPNAAEGSASPAAADPAPANNNGSTKDDAAPSSVKPTGDAAGHGNGAAVVPTKQNPSTEEPSGGDADAAPPAALEAVAAPEVAAVAKQGGASPNESGDGQPAAPAAAAASAAADASLDTKGGGANEAPTEGANEDVEAMAAAAKSLAQAAAAASAPRKETTESGAAGAAEQPKRKRTRRGGWDTPAAPGAVVKKGWEDAPPVTPVVPMTPLQELQRKLAEEQVAAAMGQAPPVTSVSAGAAALGLTMGAAMQAPGAGTRAQTAPVQPSNPRRIYVGSLHYELKESDITSIFANFGALKLVDMSHDSSTGRHKGFCFIEYVDVKAADAALRAMNGFELAGRAIKVGRPHNTDSGVAGGIEGMGLPAAMQLPGMAAFMAQHSTSAAGGAQGTGVAAEQLKAAMGMTKAPAQTKIYVGNVEPHITTEMIKTVFEPFGMVVGAEMVQDASNPGNHKGFGFIQYAQESVARTVIDTMSSFELAGRTLRVAWAQDQSKPALSVLPPGLSAAGAAAQAAAQAAKAAASAAGGAAAAQAAARLTAASRLQGLGNGGVANNGSNGGVYVVGGSAGRMHGGGVGGAKGVPGVSRCMCLVNMLGPEDADDEDTKAEILEEFGTCGTVLQLHVHKQRGSDGAVWAVRVFVVFSDPNETVTAIRKMHGRFFAGRQVQAAAYDHGMFSQGLLDS